MTITVLFFLLSGCAQLERINQEERKQESVETGKVMNPEVGVGLQVGNKLPSIALETLEGHIFDEKEMLGKKVLVNFWATWCGPCRMEMPDIIKFQKEHPDLMVIGINIGESESEIRPFVEEYQMDFPILLDKTTELAEQFEILAIPTTYFLHSDGTIAEAVKGMITYNQMKETYEKLH